MSKEPKESKPVFDVANMTTLEVMYECGRLGFQPMHAIRLLRGTVSDNCLTETAIAIEIPDSLEMQRYYDGAAMGETELGSTLRKNAIDGKKDAYKSMNTEERKRVINDVIRKNFGIGEN